MIRSAVAMLCLMLLAVPAMANECETAGADAERAQGLPPDLLVAIGRVESGRRGSDGRVAPWPWSVNANGQGYYLNSMAEAAGLVRSLQSQGIRSIDVGCFQVNIMFHPHAFASIEEAFEPAANARAAGGFLHDLHGVAEGWENAIGRYHSADPMLGLPYMRQVLASWRGGAAMVAPPISQVAALVRVIVPQAFAMQAGAVATPRKAPAPLRTAGARLPVVIVPSSSRL